MRDFLLGMLKGAVIGLACFLVVPATGCGDATTPVAPTEASPAAPQQHVIALALTVRQDGRIGEVVNRDTFFTVEAGPRCSDATLPCPRVSRVRWSVSGAFCETLGDITGPSIGVVCTGGGVTRVEAQDLDSDAKGQAQIQVRF